ncbi:hypothetical protein COO60DRAFT_1118491 [Scenedesmus sp. NREL 46B-D3]|nr:hypothetical protein COO60DRAFT_1118491 [Scenedesmus sp. NREL 46B-D3]
MRTSLRAAHLIGDTEPGGRSKCLSMDRRVCRPGCAPAAAAAAQHGMRSCVACVGWRPAAVPACALAWGVGKDQQAVGCAGEEADHHGTAHQFDQSNPLVVAACVFVGASSWHAPRCPAALAVTAPAAPSLQEQAQVVARFRSGELNVLVATNIGSEGMDFKQCAAVVAFEPPPDLTSYIQVGQRHGDSPEMVPLAIQHFRQLLSLAAQQTTPGKPPVDSSTCSVHAGVDSRASCRSLTLTRWGMLDPMWLPRLLLLWAMRAGQGQGTQAGQPVLLAGAAQRGWPGGPDQPAGQARARCPAAR